MSKSPKRETKLVSVYSDLIDKLKEISIKEGLPLTEYVNRALEQAIRARELGASIKEVVDFYERMTVQREAGLVMIPLEVFNRMIEELRREGKLSEDLWYECGQWYGKYLSMRVKDVSPTSFLIEMLKDCGWKVRWISIEEGGEVLLKCFSPTVSLEATKLFMKFIEGAVESLGYEVLSRSYLRGVIELKVRSST